jgi:ribosome biogenesis protein MAK21
LAFIKRLLICAVQSVPPIAAGLLFLISEILKARPALKTMLADVPEKPTAQSRSQNPSGKTDSDGEVGFLGNFNVAKREPEFAYAPDAMPNVWEMSLLERHYHPSVQNFTTSLVSAPEHGINFGGDPTVEFSLMAFLNRFAYKNPKKNAADNKTKHRTASQAKEEPVNIAMTAQEASADTVEPDQQFFFKYFSDKSKLVAAGRSRNKSKHQAEENGSGSDDDDSDNDDAGSDAGDRANEVESDADEAEIDRYADKLAEDLLRSAGNNIDDFDFSDEDDSDDGSAVAGAEEGEDALGDDSDGEEGLDFDQGLEGSDDEDSDSEEEAPRGKSKSAKKSAGKQEVSSKALDFADFVAEQQQMGAKKGGSKSKKTVEDDSSDDGYTGLVAYGDEDNEQLMDEDMDEEESLLGDGSSDEDLDGLNDDDHDSEDASEDGSEAGDDSADDFDSAEEEALENAGFGDSDEEMSGKKGKRGGGGKKRAAMDTFASAEDYEDLMDDIVRKVSKPAPAAAAAAVAVPAVPAAAPAGKGGKKSTPAAVAPVSSKRPVTASAPAAKAGGDQKKRKDAPAQAASKHQASGKPAAGAKRARK